MACSTSSVTRSLCLIYAVDDINPPVEYVGTRYGKARSLPGHAEPSPARQSQVLFALLVSKNIVREKIAWIGADRGSQQDYPTKVVPNPADDKRRKKHNN